MIQDLDDSRFDDAMNIPLEVSLKSFEAIPSKIGPFSTAVLRWEVTGPEGFSVELNRVKVPLKGEKIVQPKSKTVYKLIAVARGVILSLGSVTVDVDLAQHQTYQILNPQNTIQDALRTGIERRQDLYFREIPRYNGSQVTYETSSPFVTFAPGGILFKLLLGFQLEDWPNPSVDINASFGLDVEDGLLVSHREDVSVDVNVPWYVWLIPGALVDLPITLVNARESVRQDIRNAIQGLIQLLNALSDPGDGLRRQDVQVQASEDGIGIIKIQACPQDDVIQFLQFTTDALDDVVITTGN